MKKATTAPSASASIIAFPLPRFTPSDRAELHRWTKAASDVAGWFVQVDPTTGKLVTRANSGAEYAGLANSRMDAGGAYLVEPSAGQWELSDPRGNPVGSFRTLRDALECLCRTIVPASNQQTGPVN